MADPIIAVLDRQNPVVIAPYVGDAVEEGVLVRKDETEQKSVGYNEGLVKSNADPASVLLADIDAAINVLPLKIGEIKKSRVTVAELRGRGIENYVISRMEVAGAAVTLHNEIMPNTTYDLVYSHSMNVLEHWQMLKVLRPTNGTIVVLFVASVEEKTAKSLFLSLARVGDAYSFKPLYLQQGAVYVLKNVDVRRYGLLLEEQYVEPEPVEPLVIDPSLSTTEKNKKQKQYESLLRDAEAEARILEHSSVLQHEQYPDTLNAYLGRVKDANGVVVEPSFIISERLLALWYLPSVQEKTVYQMKGGCKKHGAPLIPREQTIVVTKSVYLKQLTSKLENRQYVAVSRPKNDLLTIRARQTALERLARVLDPRQLERWLLGQRLFNANPIDSVLPSTAQGNVEMERIVTGASNSAEERKRVVKELQMIVDDTIGVLSATVEGNVSIEPVGVMVDGSMTVLQSQGAKLLDRAALSAHVLNAHSRYEGSKDKENEVVYLLLDRYAAYAGIRNLPSSLFAAIERLYGPYTELFASPLHVRSKEYYSFFGFEDAIFGSRGHLLANRENVMQLMEQGGAYVAIIPDSDYYLLATSLLLKQVISATTNSLLVIVGVFGKHLNVFTGLNAQTLSLRANSYSLANGVAADASLTIYVITNTISDRSDNYTTNSEAMNTLRESLMSASRTVLPTRQATEALPFSLVEYRSLLLPNVADREAYITSSHSQTLPLRTKQLQRIFDIITVTPSELPRQRDLLTPLTRLQLFKAILWRVQSKKSKNELNSAIIALVHFDASKADLTRVMSLNTDYEEFETFLSTVDDKDYQRLLEYLA